MITAASDPETPRRGITTGDDRHRRRSLVGLAVVALLVLLGTALAASTAYRARLRLGNIDGISYMSIARQYAHGWWGDAVNAYWSPMVSWLMAPLIAGGIGPQVAFLLVNVATVGAVFALAGWLTWTTTRRPWAASFVVLALIPFGMSNVAQQSPDMLVVLWMLVFLWTLRFVDGHRHDTRRWRIGSGAVLGAVGALGYVTKLYLVPVFAAVTVLWLVVRIVDDRRAGRQDRVGQSLVAATSMLVAFVIVAAPWVTAVSMKYDEFMLGSSLQTNLASKFGPSDTDGSAPMTVTLPAPPNPHAVSPGEDRTRSVFEGGTSSGSTGSSSGTTQASLLDRARYYLGQRVLALPFYIAKINGFAPFAISIGLLFAAASVLRFVRVRSDGLACSTAIATLVYATGYALITTAAGDGGNTRYYWPLFTMTTLLAGVMLPRVFAVIGRRRVVRSGVVVVAAAAVVVASFSQHWLGRSAPFVASVDAAHPVDVFGSTTKPWGADMVAAMRADDVVPAGSRIVGTNLRETTALAFLLDAHAYGRSGEHYDVTDARFVQLLDAAHVQYLLQYTPSSGPTADFSSVGTIVGSYVDRIPCDQDTAGEQPISCRIDVVRLDR